VSFLNQKIILLTFAVSLLSSCAVLNLEKHKAPASPIEQVCNNKPNTEAIDSKLSSLLEKLQSDFKKPETRIENPDAYVTAMNEVIKASAYSYLLECPKTWESLKGHKYKIGFLPVDSNAPMSVGPSDDGKELELKVNVSASTQRVLFGYMHELLHVCQAPNVEKIETEIARAQKNVPAEKMKSIDWSGDFSGVSPKVSSYEAVMAYDRALQERYRAHTLNEILAHNLMRVAFTDFIKYSPRLCTEDLVGDKRPKKELYEVYSFYSDIYDKGQFPQHAVSWYSASLYKPSAIFDLKSAEVNFEASEFAPKFSQHRLNPLFANQIRNQGLLLTEVKK
jgi:hypothetical protein